MPLLTGSTFMFDPLCGCHRNRDHEARPRHIRGERYLAAVLAHYRLADGETHAGALARLLGGEERREETFLVLGRDAGAGIFERERGARTAAVVVRIRGHPQRSTATIHRVERVHDHVDEDLLELVGIAIYHQRIFAEPRDGPHIATRGFRL